MNICFYFQVHQPYRLRPYSVFDIGKRRDYFVSQDEADHNNERVMKKVARKSYLPTNQALLELLERHPEFQISFSFSGVAIQQFREYAPEVLESFRRLVDTGQVEVLAETSHHSLAFLYDQEEFTRQVQLHERLVGDAFNTVPRSFRNTELVYNNEVGTWAHENGYKAVLAEGWDDNLGWRSANFVYQPPQADIALLMKNYRLSDDIAFRFSQESWEGWPLTAEKFSEWVASHHGNGEVINLFMDYETFGEHQWEDTGIFDFLRQLPAELLRHPDNRFATPTQLAEEHDRHDEVSVERTTTWADTERDLSAWLGNDMQHAAINRVYALKEPVYATGDDELLETWRRLQTSDHFYYMCTKWFADGDVHAYFSPYDSPYDAFVTYMNVMQDMEARLGVEAPEQARVS